MAVKSGRIEKSSNQSLQLTLDPEQRVKRALSELPGPKREVNVRIGDLMYVFKVVEELHNFFHQREHYPTTAEVNEYLGDRDSGGCSLLHECYRDVLWRMLPADVREDIERFDI